MSQLAAPAKDLGRDWNNVATGPVKADLTIPVQWADVPRGGILGYGTMVWKIVADASGNALLVKV